MKLPLNAHSRLQQLASAFLALLLVFTPALPLWAASNSAADSSNTSPAQKDDYPRLIIGPGDLLSIFVYGETGVVSGGGGPGALGSLNQLPTDYQVDSDGKVLFPFIGPTQLGGMTPIEAAEKIARLLNKPLKVTVLVKESSTFWVSVLGNVAKPGRFQIAGRPTLMSALALAGGPLPDSDLGGAILIHDKVKSKVNLDQLLKQTSVQAEDPYLYPGDTLLVQKSGWPSTSDWAIIASIVSSAAVVTVEYLSVHH